MRISAIWIVALVVISGWEQTEAQGKEDRVCRLS